MKNVTENKDMEKALRNIYASSVVDILYLDSTLSVP